MRTTLDLDDEVFESAMHYAEGMTKTQLINDALRDFVRRHRQRELLALRGKVQWEGDIDQLRKRR